MMLMIFYFIQDLQRHSLLVAYTCLILFFCLLLAAEFSYMYYGLEFIDINDVSLSWKLCWSLDYQRTEKGFAGTCCSFSFKAATREIQREFELGLDGVFEDGDLLSSCFRFIQKKLPSSHCTSEKLVLSQMELDMVVHNGGCHCRRVRWRVQAPSNVAVWKCNCSDCSMRGNIHFIVPSEKFELLGDSKEFLTTYTFGTHTAKHTFCKVCGITSFYFPRSNPDGVAVTYRCVDPGTLTHVEIKHYDGRNWESSYNQSGIASHSKLAE